ncbi:hypothetical protein [Jeotgalibacillus aurantiacus]|uniref:hypothetical protein n=1 Tax=Jeotgalibacillus aurantiacus TaxID=2763266 RepID=UPI001D0A39B6|nr:hypothetical protein [Jeotgalibacillus aurantiacus]
MERKLFLWIGLFIFPGMALQTLLQVESSYWIEAFIAIAVAAVIYTVLIVLKDKNRTAWLASLTLLGAAAVLFIFIGESVFPHH